MTVLRTTDRELYVRGSATLLASWEEYTRGSAGAALVRLPATLLSELFELCVVKFCVRYN